MSEPQALESALVPIDSVRPDPRNAREHNERNLASIVESLRAFGQRKPIVVTRADGIIRAGNGAWLAAKREGWSSINVTFTDLAPEDAAKFAIADNRIGELSYFDDGLLAEQLRGLDATELLAIGFDQAEASEILDASQELVLDPKTGSTGQAQGNGGSVSVRVLVTVANVELFERAMQATGKSNREQALLEVCGTYVNLHAKALDAAGQLDAH